MPSSEWATPEAIEAATAEYDAGRRMGLDGTHCLRSALTAAAKASPVIPAPKCETCGGEGVAQCGPDELGDCPDCHGTGVAEVKDLRGVEHRSVHRDDVVVITGAEYLRKSRLAGEAEAARQENALYGEPVAEVIPVAVLREWEQDWRSVTTGNTPRRSMLDSLATLLDEHARKPVAEATG